MQGRALRPVPYRMQGAMTRVHPRQSSLFSLPGHWYRIECIVPGFTAPMTVPKHYLNSVEVAIQHANTFLVIQRPQGVNAGGLLAFPGGKVDENDEHHEWDMLRHAAKREVREEVGLDLKDDLHYATSTYFTINDDKPLHVICTLFHCVLDKTDMAVCPSPREVAAYSWLTVDAINQAHNAPPWLKKDLYFIVCP